MISWPEKEQVCTTRPVASRLPLSLSLILVGSCFFRMFSSAKPRTNDVPGRVDSSHGRRPQSSRSLQVQLRAAGYLLVAWVLRLWRAESTLGGSGLALCRR